MHACPPARAPGTWPITLFRVLYDLVASQRHLDLVDEIYVEMHFFYPYMFGKAFAHHSMVRFLQLCSDIRHAVIQCLAVEYSVACLT